MLFCEDGGEGGGEGSHGGGGGGAGGDGGGGTASKGSGGLVFSKMKILVDSLIIFFNYSVVDPDPVGSVSFGRIRIRIGKCENGSLTDPGSEKKRPKI